MFHFIILIFITIILIILLFYIFRNHPRFVNLKKGAILAYKTPTLPDNILKFTSILVNTHLFSFLYIPVFSLNNNTIRTLALITRQAGSRRRLSLALVDYVRFQCI